MSLRMPLVVAAVLMWQLSRITQGLRKGSLAHVACRCFACFLLCSQPVTGIPGLRLEDAILR